MKKIIIIFFVLIAVTVVSLKSFVDYWKDEHKKNLRSMKELSLEYPQLPIPARGIILLIYAHSDDEIATIAQVARLKRENPGLIFKWYIVSNGGRGFIYPGSCTGLTKEECRYNEARAVAECAGIAAPTIIGLPDGEISDEKNLASLLHSKIPELSSTDVKFIFTHDNRGLYGHSDHIAVYDVVKERARLKNIPLVTLALPQYFKDGLILMGKAREREAATITHSLNLNEVDISVKVCAVEAHQSQKLLMNLLMLQGLGAQEFFENSPREFLHVD